MGKERTLGTEPSDHSERNRTTEIKRGVRPRQQKRKKVQVEKRAQKSNLGKTAALYTLKDRIVINTHRK